MSLADLLGPQVVLPFMEVEDPAAAVALARVLADGGLPVMEIALRTPVALAAIEAVRASESAVTVGAGTVTTAAQLEQAVGAGASFAVSPGSSDELLVSGGHADIPFIPGVATATELMRVVEAGFREVKVFPAEPAGGIATVASLAVVFPGVRFLPTGGIDQAGASGYLRLPAVLAVGGSWVCPKDLVRDGSWGQITERVRAASRLVRAGSS